MSQPTTEDSSGIEEKAVDEEICEGLSYRRSSLASDEEIRIDKNRIIIPDSIALGHEEMAALQLLHMTLKDQLSR